MRIRSGGGLGDSIYLRPVAEHYQRAGRRVVALSNYPAVFDGAGVVVEPFRRDRVDLVAHYTGRKTVAGTTQWQDVCISAGLATDLPLRFEWQPRNGGLLRSLRQRAAGRPLVMVHGGRLPMDRVDRFGIELMPAKRGFDAVLGRLSGCFLVQVGSAPQQYPLAAELDLNGRTSVSDLLDIASVAAGVVAQCSFAVPLAEAFGKPLLAVWSSLGLASRETFIRTCTPEKILGGAKDGYVMDDWDEPRIAEAVDAFRRF